eukprot:gene9919-7788_t
MIINDIVPSAEDNLGGAAISKTMPVEAKDDDTSVNDQPAREQPSPAKVDTMAPAQENTEECARTYLFVLGEAGRDQNLQEEQRFSELLAKPGLGGDEIRSSSQSPESLDPTPTTPSPQNQSAEVSQEITPQAKPSFFGVDPPSPNATSGFGTPLDYEPMSVDKGSKPDENEVQGALDMGAGCTKFSEEALGVEELQPDSNVEAVTVPSTASQEIVVPCTISSEILVPSTTSHGIVEGASQEVQEATQQPSTIAVATTLSECRTEATEGEDLLAGGYVPTPLEAVHISSVPEEVMAMDIPSAGPVGEENAGLQSHSEANTGLQSTEPGCDENMAIDIPSAGPVGEKSAGRQLAEPKPKEGMAIDISSAELNSNKGRSVRVSQTDTKQSSSILAGGSLCEVGVQEVVPGGAISVAPEEGSDMVNAAASVAGATMVCASAVVTATTMKTDPAVSRQPAGPESIVTSATVVTDTVMQDDPSMVPHSTVVAATAMKTDATVSGQPAGPERVVASATEVTDITVAGRSKSAGQGGPAQVDEEDSGSAHEMQQMIAELRGKLTRVEHSRDELARHQGQYKATIAKFEGTVSSTDRRVKQQATECEQLKATVQVLQKEMAETKVMINLTPERCREGAKSLLQETTRAQSSAASKETVIRKLQDLMKHEADETSQLVKEAKRSQELISGEMYFAKERNVEIEGDLARAQHQLQQLTEAKHLADSSVQARDRAERERMETKESSMRMFKQMKGISHAMERQSHLFHNVPELTLTVRGLQEWVQSYEQQISLAEQ